MCALAGLPARAAARLRALEAGAPALAAAATCPLHPADLLQPDARRLLTPLLVPELFEPASVEGGLTLREARLILECSAVAVTLARIARRIVWRDLRVAKRELCASRARGEQSLPGSQSLPECGILATLSLMLSCPFTIGEGADRRAAIREAAVRCARVQPQALLPAPRARAAVRPCAQPAEPLARRVHRVLRARRYAACDAYGLAAGLAASFADLAASCPNSELDKFLTCTLLRTCAPWVQRVRPGARDRQQAALHRPPQAGCAPRRRWCTGACPPSQRRGARPARPGPPSWRSTTPACRPCSSG